MTLTFEWEAEECKLYAKGYTARLAEPALWSTGCGSCILRNVNADSEIDVNPNTRKTKSKDATCMVVKTKERCWKERSRVMYGCWKERLWFSCCLELERKMQLVERDP